MQQQNKSSLAHRKRTISRLMAIQIFYQFDFFKGENHPNDLKNELIDNYILFEGDEVKSYRDKIDGALLENLINGMQLALTEIDLEVSAFLKKDPSLEKLSNVLVQILRFGAFELKFSKDIPLKVLINEYVDISACFFDKAKITLVNSMLENLAKKYREEEFLTVKNNRN